LTESDSKEKILDLLIENTALGWDKKKLVITNLDDEVNQIIERGLANGAAAAKLCGAGGSGFVLFLAKPERIQKLRDSFPASQVVTPLFDSQGVQVNEL
jgi:D-glycero-alpha-D-manno-heptose-7-phosphate kinase